MNTQNLDYAIEGQLAKFYDLAESPSTDNITEQALRDLGIQEQEIPKDAAQSIKSYADQLKAAGKRPRAIRRAVARRFNIRILD